ncbi:MAG: OmpA family protein [Owenweeksia sp.]|nr:OmpA family protein [Owenweeksia sp.]
MKFIYKPLILLSLSLFFISPSQGQSDIEGSEDHPLISRYPGSYIASYELEKYREYQLATGPVTGYRYIEEKQTIAGQLTRITYYLEKGADQLSIGEVYQDYLEAFEKENIAILGKGLQSQRNVSSTVGGGTWIGVALKPNAFTSKSAANNLFAGTSTSGGTFSIIGEVARGGKSTYLALYGERHSDKLVVCHLDIMETKAAETGKVTANADYIRKEIEDKGSVSIYGITFDFDKSSIKPESKLALDEMAKYLKDNPGISLYIVGHTDMKGSYEYNLKLSRDRARAVVEKLIKDYGIASDRLTPDGVAFLSPKATNQTEDGRALNRRTELVHAANL